MKLKSYVMMTSREIIIDLIDRQIIDGEKAFTLINDLLQSELMESWKILNDKGSNKSTTTTPIWINNPLYTSATSATWSNNDVLTVANTNKASGSSI